MSGRPEIMVSPTGARRAKVDHPALPLSPEEIAAAAAACQAAGAGALHLHIRDAAGRHSLDPGLYRQAMGAVAAAAPGLQVQVTTEAAGRFDAAAQLDCVQRLRPAWASVAVREIDSELADRFYGFCADEGVRLQHILYDARDVAELQARRRAGLARLEQNEVIYVLGSYADQRPGRPEEIDILLKSAGSDWRWSVCAFGRTEQACLLHAAARGAHGVRIGFENNIERPDGTHWADNAEAVAALAAALAKMEWSSP